jgi:hypothetical protein
LQVGRLRGDLAGGANQRQLTGKRLLARNDYT